MDSRDGTRHRRGAWVAPALNPQWSGAAHHLPPRNAWSSDGSWCNRSTRQRRESQAVGSRPQPSSLPITLWPLFWRSSRDVSARKRPTFRGMAELQVQRRRPRDGASRARSRSWLRRWSRTRCSKRSRWSDRHPRTCSGSSAGKTYRRGRSPIGTEPGGRGMGIDRRGSGSCSLQTSTMRIVPANPDWSRSGGSPRATITRRVASILHWVSSSTCSHRMIYVRLPPRPRSQSQRALRARVADVLSWPSGSATAVRPARRPCGRLLPAPRGP